MVVDQEVIQEVADILVVVEADLEDTQVMEVQEATLEEAEEGVVDREDLAVILEEAVEMAAIPGEVEMATKILD